MAVLTDHLDPSVFPDITERLGDVTRAAEALGSQAGLTFLDPAEVIERRDEIRESNSDFLDNILFVAEDAGGALYGVWLRGKLSGMWTMFDHHEIDISPAWRNVDDFIAHAKSGELRPSLPDFGDGATAEDHQRWAEVRHAYASQFEPIYQEDPESMYAIFFAYSIIALTPRADAGSLIPFLSLDNQWIVERAAVTLGGYRHQAARPALAELAGTSGNGALAARGALKQLDEA